MEYVRLGGATNFPFRTMSQFLKFFQETDPVILQHMKAGKRKVSSIVRNVLRPSEESKFIDIIKKIKSNKLSKTLNAN